MFRSVRTLFTVAGVMMAATAVSAQAADAPALTGFRGEVVANMQEAGDKIIELSGAMPVGKWTWRPGKGVRSVGEVYMHVVSGNYFLCTFLGAVPPMPAEQLQKLEAAPANPQKTAEMLRDSYAFVAKTIAAIPDTDLDAEATFFGRKTTKRAVMLAIASHSHEHLGQSIAYARMCGVVPPWTARERAAAKQAAAAKKSTAEHDHSH
jgi:uncharacterized damage-inducible protein DinB